MPIKLIPPRKDIGQTSWYMRGAYLGVRINRTTGTSRKSIAKQILKKCEEDIERGRLDSEKGETFVMAANRYSKNGGDDRPIMKLVEYFGHKPLRPSLPPGETIENYWQREVDNAAAALFPTHSAATRNREVYTPCSAILKCGGLRFQLIRPKGSRGRELTGWLRKEEAEALLKAAYGVDHEFGLFCHFLLFTGLRLTEGARWFTCNNLNLQEAYAFIPRTKNGHPRAVYLPAHLVAALANHPRGLDRGSEPVFRFHKGGRLYDMLADAAEKAPVVLPPRQAFHILRHTYGTWMTRYAGMTAKGLVAAGVWKDERAAGRYQHMIVTEEAQKAALLPAPKIKVG